MDFLKNYPKHQKLYFLTPISDNFEELYLEIRNQEGRIYEDDLVTQLPLLPKEHPQYLEWKYRILNTRRLLENLAQSKHQFILDLGCGNGWFTNQLATNTKAKVLGLDVNKIELLQAGRLFESDSCFFAYGDVFQEKLPKHFFNAIILNSCIQYFPDLNKLISRLKKLLSENGVIHILDSPFYKKNKLAQAQQRSHSYYQNQGNSKMAQHYFHHSWESLQEFNYEIKYDPDTLPNKMKRKFLGLGTPFPWIRIKPK